MQSVFETDAYERERYIDNGHGDYYTWYASRMRLTESKWKNNC